MDFKLDQFKLSRDYAMSFNQSSQLLGMTSFSSIYFNSHTRTRIVCYRIKPNVSGLDVCVEWIAHNTIPIFAAIKHLCVVNKTKNKLVRVYILNEKRI